MFCNIFGKSLALRGEHGTKSVHAAVNTLHFHQTIIFGEFVLTGLTYLVSHVFEVCVFNKEHVAKIVYCIFSM